MILLVTLLTTAHLVTASPAKANNAIELISTENHHVIMLNANQPYVAGYHVDALDLYTRERVDAMALTVSFHSIDTSYFPSESWLGGGMFIQGQDDKLKHVDYAFYMMLVLDDSGALFVDLGLHQTRELTAPLQMPTEELVYAYTWQVLGINFTTPVTLLARWDSEGFVHYSISASGINTSLTSINVASLPNCGSIQRHFYSGNRPTTTFPFGHFVHYFQFGIVSTEIIDNNYWSVALKDPKILRKPESHLGTGWCHVDTAWSIQGDISYIDADWKWGGTPYYGVSARYNRNPLDNTHEVIFFYNGQTLPPGTILWQYADSESSSVLTTVPSTLFNEILEIEPMHIFYLEIVVVTCVVARRIFLCKPRSKQRNK